MYLYLIIVFVGFWSETLVSLFPTCRKNHPSESHDFILLALDGAWCSFWLTFPSPSSTLPIIAIASGPLAQRVLCFIFCAACVTTIRSIMHFKNILNVLKDPEKAEPVNT